MTEMPLAICFLNFDENIQNCMITLYHWIVLECGSLSHPGNGTVTHSSPTFEIIATYSCDVGYLLIGEMTRVCQADGNWNSTAPVCEIQGIKTKISRSVKRKYIEVPNDLPCSLTVEVFNFNFILNFGISLYLLTFFRRKLRLTISIYIQLSICQS